MPETQAAYGAQNRESGLSAVSLRPCGPLALIPVNEKKNEIGGEFGPKMAAACDLRIPGGESNE